MMRVAFDIELLDDCVLSARNATAGAHACLDHVPGSALLGIAAAGLYRELSAAAAFRAFHSGTLRFGNGLPLDGEVLAWPVSHCLHKPKTEPATDADGHFGPNVANRLLVNEQVDVPLKPLREGYVSAAGRWLKPRRTQRMKTAIDPASGRARDSQLFGYQALAAGSRFRAVLEADAEFDAALFDRVCRALAGRRLLGRSRSGEYGRVHIRRLEAECAALPERRASTDDSHLLWLLSDLAPCDAAGRPAVHIDPAALGLGPVTVDYRRSFIRTRRYAPWNAARRGHDQEREVLTAGSVLCLRGPAPTADALARGLGLYREQGLGRVCLDAALLFEPHPFRASAGNAARREPATPPRPASPLLAWLQQQADGAGGDLDECVSAEARKIGKALADGRTQNGVRAGQDFGPSRQQWARIMNTASHKHEPAALRDALFAGDNAIIKRRAKGWQESLRMDGRWLTLAEWLEQRFGAWRDDPELGPKLAEFTRLLAHRMSNETEKR